MKPHPYNPDLHKTGKATGGVTAYGAGSQTTRGKGRPSSKFGLGLPGHFLWTGLVLGIALLLCYIYFFPPVWAVILDGEVLGYVSQVEEVRKAVALLAESEASRIGAQVAPENSPSFVRTRPPQGAMLVTPETMAEVLSEKMEFRATGYVIRVDGQDVVALPSEEDARLVLSSLREQYVQSISGKSQATVEEVLIKENIEIVEKTVSTRMFRSKEDALRILVRGTDKIVTHIVQRGECLWTIAQANHMTVDDLRKANPQVKGDIIHEGDSLNLVVPDPYVTIQSKEKVVFTVSIPYATEVTYDDSLWPWQERVLVEGKNGQKLVTQEVVRENGQEVSRRTVDERILSYPVTRKVVRGSKQVPPMGSGQMAWPVKGRVTSYFGQRWGSFHSGIDIAAPAGTPVLAADNGMVSYRGWNGGYGRLVLIDHGNGTVTAYAHLSGYEVSVGDRVEKGQVIGYVGSSGNSTGPHLHFEVRVNGVAKNPLDYYK
ncbi:MAG: M23 family metallopeptidase [Firmicutes bacterium]|nr:M23 family metallopeptidase [Candidatus Fermentithermobacillaceae bacterium]